MGRKLKRWFTFAMTGAALALLRVAGWLDRHGRQTMLLPKRRTWKSGCGYSVIRFSELDDDSRTLVVASIRGRVYVARCSCMSSVEDVEDFLKLAHFGFAAEAHAPTVGVEWVMGVRDER